MFTPRDTEQILPCVLALWLSVYAGIEADDFFLPNSDNEAADLNFGLPALISISDSFFISIY